MTVRESAINNSTSLTAGLFRQSQFLASDIMPVSIFDGCTEQCGWTAAFVGALTYGSYGVPIKETKKIDVHPLVVQVRKEIDSSSQSDVVI
jgi:hypothetical protein